jgi:hypothetical protein
LLYRKDVLSLVRGADRAGHHRLAQLKAMFVSGRRPTTAWAMGNSALPRQPPKA